MSDASGRTECVFWAIVAGTLPASIVYRDDLVLVLLGIHPRNPGHTLVIPLMHFASLAELPKSVGARTFVVAQQIAAAIRRTPIRCEAISLGLADGRAAGQEVPHCHLHVRPRFAGDARRVGLPTRTELDALAAQLRGFM